jgi:hypothetical protein
MQTIQLWDVAPDAAGMRDAMPLQAVSTDETERLLEDLIVRRPELLGAGVVLLGRQIATEGGPLDLLGVDQDGRIVIFELKRGTLTRDAVAQVLDYASDLAEKGEDKLARLVEVNSGKNGIAEIEDFEDWYSQQYPDADGPLALPPRMVIVGLGVDERARRITGFLSQRGIEIHLLTFHAFRGGERLFLARQVESDAPRVPPPPGAPNKETNRKILHESAAELGVTGLLEDVGKTVATRLAGSYQWPGKTSYAFSLQEQTDAGRPTLRAYITVYLDSKRKGSLLFNITPRAAAAGSVAVEALVRGVPPEYVRHPANQYVEFELRLTDRIWREHRSLFEAALDEVLAGWQRKASATQIEEERPEPTTVHGG